MVLSHPKIHHTCTFYPPMSVFLGKQEARSTMRTETASVLFVSIFSNSQGCLGAQHLLKAKRGDEGIRVTQRDIYREIDTQSDRETDRERDRK